MAPFQDLTNNKILRKQRDEESYSIPSLRICANGEGVLDLIGINFPEMKFFILKNLESGVLIKKEGLLLLNQYTLKKNEYVKICCTSNFLHFLPSTYLYVMVCIKFPTKMSI